MFEFFAAMAPVVDVEPVPVRPKRAKSIRPPRTGITAFVLQAIREEPNSTVADIAEATNLDSQAVSGAASKLYVSGHVERDLVVLPSGVKGFAYRVVLPSDSGQADSP